MIGERLLALRSSRNLTLAAVAQRLTISYQQVQKYERGQSSMSVARLYDFAQIYEVAPAEFFRELPPNAGLGSHLDLSVPGFADSPEGQSFLSAIAHMPPGARRTLLAFLRALPTEGTFTVPGV
ncbi:helix-turn-helix domain-containing protein [Paenirhodobacter populi]|uniref:XRE family transcriptional regulator n=2 Tax=Paenirhodobacter populi TaxID=2306993 RepID=A0A443JRD5_9RHOB|nr:XRE family transcriptional regulator [Sinirhodobacter populi]